jgi:hypothetical protein
VNYWISDDTIDLCVLICVRRDSVRDIILAMHLESSVLAHKGIYSTEEFRIIYSSDVRNTINSDVLHQCQNKATYYFVQDKA